MIDVASLGSIIDGAGALPHHELHGYIPEPAESHHLFGAAFLFIGVLLIVETLAGSVWHRNRLRTTLWPAAIMTLGAGMVVVTALEPNDRLIHFTIGIIMLAAGWFEYRHRMGEVSRRTADLLIVPALIAGALEIGVFHFHGSFNNSASVHVLLGVTTALMVFVRVYQSRLITSPPRHALMGVMVIALAFELMALSH
ncbi:MAG: hypothetical protein IH822_06790 [Chloroflexi bacterium]|nr:hypothetical protein [Chloroflexota bacterium]